MLLLLLLLLLGVNKISAVRGQKQIESRHMPDVNNMERTETKAKDIPEEKPSPAYRFDKQSLEENSSTGCQLNGRRRDKFYPKALVLVFPDRQAMSSLFEVAPGPRSTVLVSSPCLIALGSCHLI